MEYYYEIDMNKTIYSKNQQYLVMKLKKARLESGLNQSEVAKILKVTQSYISKIEAGQIKIDINQLGQLANIYKKKLKDFVKGQNGKT